MADSVAELARTAVPGFAAATREKPWNNAPTPSMCDTIDTPALCLFAWSSMAYWLGGDASPCLAS